MLAGYKQVAANSMECFRSMLNCVYPERLGSLARSITAAFVKFIKHSYLFPWNGKFFLLRNQLSLFDTVLYVAPWRARLLDNSLSRATAPGDFAQRCGNCGLVGRNHFSRKRTHVRLSNLKVGGAGGK